MEKTTYTKDQIDVWFNQQFADPTANLVAATLEYYKDYKAEDYKVIELHPKIFIYRNLMPNVNKTASLIKASTQDNKQSFFFSDWHQWGGWHNRVKFGEYIVQIGKDIKSKKSESDLNSTLLFEERDALIEVLQAFRAATNHYRDHFNLTEYDNWGFSSPSFGRYMPSTSTAEDGNLMAWHTDYEIEKAAEPGWKYVLTTTMYLNSDYEGGEIIFKVGENKEVISYKPQAGDVLVFPSGHPAVLMEGERPIMHAVKPIGENGNDRFIVRVFHHIYSEHGDDIQEILKNNKDLNETAIQNALSVFDQHR